MNVDDHAQLRSALARLQEGDRSAAREVFNSLWPVLLSFCSKMLADPSRTEDVSQRVMIKMFAQIDRFNSGRDGLGWALEIALWECRTERTRNRRAREISWNRSANDVETGENSPEQLVIDHNLKLALEVALDKLPKSDRGALVDSLSSSTRQALSAASRKRKQRALFRLKQIWRRLYGE